MVNAVAKRNLLLSLLLLAGTACGCRPTRGPQDATVQGTVTIDGELATSGTVAFHPIGGGPIAYGNIHLDGSYSLRTGQGNMRDADKSKIFSDDYIVSVVVTAPPENRSLTFTSEMPNERADGPESEPDGQSPDGLARLGAEGPPWPGVRLTAAKYASKETSDLRFTVEPGLNIFAISLKSATEELLEAEVGSELEESTVRHENNDFEQSMQHPGDPPRGSSETANANKEEGLP